MMIFPIWVSAQVNIIPRPASLEQVEGHFRLTRETRIVASAPLRKDAVLLNFYLKNIYGFTLEIAAPGTGSKKTNIISLVPALATDSSESYHLAVNSGSISIRGQDAGVFYGIQTLLQLLPPEKTRFPVDVPCVNIDDHPRFAYRGMHLDVSRHFFPVDYIKRYIDYIALHKMNRFHWHLTDDQGWRIEIKKYPKLTSIGSCRNGTIIGRYPGTGNDGIHYCGYYTQEQIKEVVRYAAQRYITVIPEIEMPGHSLAAIVAYPELSTTPEIPKQVGETWGTYDKLNNVFNPTEHTFSFLEDVLTEVMQLFPSKYIHIGGDECSKKWWKESAFCQALMKKEGLKNEEELQSYFIHRIEKFLNSKGRLMMGWDEILEGGLAPNATVMSWRGEEGGIAAAKQDHDVVMTPGGWCYFDHAQSRNEDSVTIGSYLPVEKVYSYEPVPAALDETQARHVLGAQGNVWTEYIANTRKVEYMIFPRMSALSEVLWSPKSSRNWDDFEKRLQVQFKRYDLWNSNYSRAYFELRDSIAPAKNNDGLLWYLSTRLKNTPVNYRAIAMESPPTGWFGTNPFQTTYTGPVLLQSNTWTSAEIPQGSRITRFFSFNKLTGKKIRLLTPPASGYQGNGGAFGLVNGLSAGDKGINSTEWLGWSGKDLNATIDLGSPQDVHSVTVSTLSQEGSWIYLPASVEVAVSADGTDWKTLPATTDKQGTTEVKITLAFDTQHVQYVRVVAKNYGTIPDGKAGAGNPAWLFVDELAAK